MNDGTYWDKQKLNAGGECNTTHIAAPGIPKTPAAMPFRKHDP